MKIYTFVYGLESDITVPAYEEGVFLSHEKAFIRQKELNRLATSYFYEEGWGENCWPDDNELCDKLDFKGNWDALDKEINKHRIIDLDEICRLINKMEEPPCDFYQMVECEVIK